jgi:ATP-dependent DNA helicase RecG
LDWYQNLAEHPFRIDPISLQRDDSPPDYIAFREAAINLLIHQDYSDHARKPEIRVYQDRTVFWNPGDAFASISDLLEPGQKEVRNPRIVTAFRRIGFSEHAGWGLPEVFRNWQALGRVPPRIVNNKAHKTFELSLLKELLLSEEQLLLQASLGVHLSEDEARTFAYACRQPEITLSDITAITGQRGAAARQIADRLCTQLLLAPADPANHYMLAEHLRERFSGQANQHPVLLFGSDIDQATEQVDTAGQDLSTEQVGDQRTYLSTEQVQPLTSLSETQWRIVAFCDIPRTLNEIMAKLGMGSRGHFKNRHLDPLIRGGVVHMTNPDKPQASNQRYVLSEVGAQLKTQRLAKKRGPDEE